MNPSAQAHFEKLPIVFEPNQGQTDAHVRFLARGGYTAYLTDTEVIIDSLSAAPVRMRPTCAQAPRSIEGLQRTSGATNYLTGSDASQWHTGIPNYLAVHYTAACPGIDITYYGTGRQLEYDFTVSPGTDPRILAIDYNGLSSLTLTSAGDLLMRAGTTEFIQRKPHVYQRISGRDVIIPAAYRLVAGSRVTFALGKYDRSKPLVIDPVLVYSTYLGGTGGDSGSGIAVDASGNMYVAGATLSTNFPTTVGSLQTANAGNYDAFVTKISSDGTTKLYSTYLGGAGSDFATSIQVDGSGNAYIVGETTSTAFPTVNPIQAFAGSHDAFAAKLNSTGTALLYSTFLGGTGDEQATSVAVDSSGNAYVVGWTNSINFPTTVGVYQTTNHGTENAFVVKLNAAGTSKLYSTCLGGTNVDLATGVAVDASGNAYVTGAANSTDYPIIAGAAQSSKGGLSDGFVTKLNSSGTALIYSTFLGGTADDHGAAIAIDGTGRAYVAGGTASANLPVHSAFQSSFGGSTDAFIAKVSATGASFEFLTYLGGSGADTAAGIALDSGGNAVVTGTTTSSDFPLQNPLYSTGGVFVTKVSVDGTFLAYSTRLTGNPNDAATSVAVNSAGKAFITGLTTSASFPTVSPLQPTYTGGANGNAFVSVIGPGNQAPGSVSVSPSSGSGPVQTFSFTFADLDGYADLNVAQVVINSSLSGTNGCYFWYTRASNVLYLRDNANSSWLGPVSPGSGGSVQNSQCIISAGSSSVSSSGTTLTLNVALTFQPAFGGPKNVYMYVQDNAGANAGWQARGTWTVPSSSNSAPSAVSVSPSSGSGSIQTFGFTFSDPDGYGDLDVAQIVINSSFSGTNGCYFWYTRSSNLIYLRNDANSGWLGPVSPGGSGTVQNSQCSLNASSSSVSGVGTTLTLNLALTFQSGFAGAKNVYMYVQDVAAANSGWQTRGTWTVPASGNSAPSAVSVSPSSGTGASQTFGFTFSDPNGYTDLDVAQIVINGSFTGNNSCYFWYARSSNLIYLRNDANSAWLGPVSAGGSGTVQNSQCSLSASSSSVSGVGTTLTLNLALTFQTGFAGAKNVYMYVQDVAAANSGWQTRGTWTVPASGNSAPSAVSVSPSSGSGSVQTFSFTFSDPNGYTDLDVAQIVINGSFASTSSCYFWYTRSSNLIYLRNDANSAWLGPVSPGGSGTVQNSQCSLSAASSSVSGVGTTLTLNLALTFQPAFTGAKNVYMYVQDVAAANSGWQTRGTWTVP